MFVQGDGLQLIEPAPPLELMFSGLGRIELIGGGLACWVLYRQGIALATGELEQLVCGRLYGPAQAMTEASRLLASAQQLELGGKPRLLI